MIIQVVSETAMVVSQMKLNALVQNLIPGRRESQPAVIDVCRVVSLVGKAKVKHRILCRLHFQVHLATTRTRRDRRAKRIEEAFRSIRIAGSYRRAQKWQRLIQSQLIGVAVMS